MHFRNWHPKFLERYRKEGDTIVIEVALQSVSDLFEDKDPSPIRLRDIKPSVETYIVNCVREIPLDQKLRVDFCFYDYAPSEHDEVRLEKSIRNFFNYSAQVEMLSFKFKIKNGLKSFVIGLCFLFACIYISHTFENSEHNLLQAFFGEGLSVLGWVSLWTPVQIFLYEIWPILSMSRSLRRCSELEISFKEIFWRETL